jgi:hypothetical protein
MDPTEVLAIEIRQYTGHGEQVLVPRVLGRTAAARQKKESSAGKAWDKASWLAGLEEAAGSDAAAAATAILDWVSKTTTASVKFGSGVGKGSATLKLQAGGSVYSPFRLWTDGNAVFLIAALRRHSPFTSAAMREQYIDMLAKIPGVALTHADVDRKPKVPITTFGDPEAREKLFEALLWVAEQAALNEDTPADD